MAADEVPGILGSCSEQVRDIALQARTLIRNAIPDAVEEVDEALPLLGYTFIPGTYKGLFAAIAPQASHVNLMFSRGVELEEIDGGELLEGTGKKARHVKLRSPEDVTRREVLTLVEAAAERAPRS